MLCNVDGMDPEDVSNILDGDFGIATRAGLHCAPLVHEDLGTSPQGGVRFSLGPFNTDEEIDEVLEAMTTLTKIK
jgi:selenocysteine lyase/cysteine desulfurase